MITSKHLWQLCISGPEVKSLQSELNKQFSKGLKVDGYFGNSTLNACVTVKEGARGNITKLMQHRLIEKGYKLSCGPDGIFGSGTLRAVKKFQRANGLDADGIVGKNTWKELFLKFKKCNIIYL